jgi:hypothetical protein
MISMEGSIRQILPRGTSAIIPFDGIPLEYIVVFHPFEKDML